MDTQKTAELAIVNSAGSNLVATRRLNFTKKAIEKLPWPTTSRHVYFHDEQVRGLTVRVSFTGSKVFVLYRKVNRRPERIVLGPFPDLSIDQARGKAEELNGAIAVGQNPAAQKRQVRDEATLKELFATFAEHHGQRKRSWKEMKRMFDVYLKPLHYRKISSISKLDVINLHARLEHDRGPYMANRVLELLRSMFARAIEWEWPGTNPTTSVKVFKETKRERFLLREEAPRFFKALKAEPEDVRDFVLISLLTGARRGNVQSMAWSEIDLGCQAWNIPASQAKAGEPLTIPLVARAMQILKRRKKAATKEWVFPSHSASGHIEEVKRAWGRIVTRAGLTDLRFHDLRRTAGSWQAIQGSSLVIIGKSLGHKSSASTQVYARLSDAPVRQSMEKGLGALLLAGNVKAR